MPFSLFFSFPGVFIRRCATFFFLFSVPRPGKTRDLLGGRDIPAAFGAFIEIQVKEETRLFFLFSRPHLR